jgi:hypothetical protein
VTVAAALVTAAKKKRTVSNCEMPRGTEIAETQTRQLSADPMGRLDLYRPLQPVARLLQMESDPRVNELPSIALPILQHWTTMDEPY